MTAVRWGLAAFLALLGATFAWAQNASPQCPDQLAGLRSSIWKTLEIPVCWESMGREFEVERQWVQRAVQGTWEKHSALRFTDWGACRSSSRGIRIGVAEENPHTKGLGSRLNGVPNGMVLNFTFQRWSPDCSRSNKREYCIKNLAVHEFGHALGFAHEQNRADAPDWCQAERQGTDGDINITPYDLQSVMNYCNPKWGGDGELSKLDIQGLQAWYGKPNQPLTRYDGRWVGYMTYSDPACVADSVDVTITGNAIRGAMSTPDGRRVPIQATVDDAGQIRGFQMRLSPKDLITLRGSLTDGTLISTDCGCGAYNFKRRP